MNRLTIKKQKNRDSLVISLKYFSDENFTDKQVLEILREKYNIKISLSTIKNIKRKYNQKNLT